MSRVNQIDYWSEDISKENNQSNISNISDGNPGQLSYNTYLKLSVIGGFFALDHLYLRSPLTGFAKIFVNIVFFGAWWIYDASHAFFNSDIIKVFGLSIPGLGPQGIGAGCLSDEPNKKHMSFLIYGIALLFGGLFGLDSFITGDKVSGGIRIFCLMTAIFSPVAIIWWLFNIFKFVFQTKDVTNKYWEFFGAPQPTIEQSLVVNIATKIPFFGKILEPIIKIGESLGMVTSQTLGTVKNIAELAAKDPDAAIALLASGPLQKSIVPAIKPIINSAKPITNTIQLGLHTLDDGIALGHEALDKGSKIAEEVVKTTGDVAQGLSVLAPLVSGIPAMTQGITTSTAKSVLNKMDLNKMDLNKMTEMKGGNIESNVLPFMLLGTIALITVSGFILTYRKSKHNERNKRDDTPPQAPQAPLTRVL